jgi:3-oxoacyl-[acyl-carrier protein] reductase
MPITFEDERVMQPDFEPQWELGPEGHKGFVERITMRRMGTPQDIADAVMFLASDYASWITGILPVKGSPT